MEQQPPVPTPYALASALVAIGAMREMPAREDLDRQAEALGGDLVLSTYLANALYGAAASVGMITEGALFERYPEGGPEVQKHARAEAAKASGADGPGWLGWLAWQAGQAAAPIRGAANGKVEAGPLLSAAADALWAGNLLLRCACYGFDHNPEAAELLRDGVKHLEAALAASGGMLDTAADLAEMLVPFLAAMDGSEY